MTNTTKDHGDFIGVIKAALQHLASGRSLASTLNNLPAAGSCGGDLIDNKQQNLIALRALARIEGPNLPNVASFGTVPLSYRYGSAVKFNNTFSNTNIFYAISAMMANLDSQQMYSHTLWDLLINLLLPLFGLELCPAIDRAVIMPSLPGWRGNNGKYWRHLSSQELVVAEERAALVRPLRAVVVGAGNVNETNANMSGKGKEFPKPLSGMYGIKQIDAEEGDYGVILYEQAPMWLAGAVTVQQQRNGKTAAGTADQPVNSATTPGSGDKSGDVSPDIEPVMVNALSCYAKSRFVHYMLQGRIMLAVCPLRFDLAPGSHVSYQLNSEHLASGSDPKNSDQLAGTRYADITRVSIRIDAELRQAETAIQLANTRNSEENKSDRTSVDTHPLFDGSIGAQGGLPLLPELE